MNDHTNDLTPHEEAEFAALPRERVPGRLLEERTVRMLRSRGLLQRNPFRRGWIVTAAAAAVALFATGFAAGQWTTSRGVATTFLQATQQLTAMQAAQMVQRTGSAYVTAIEALVQMQDSNGTQALDQGREAALAALYAAAGEVGSLAPEDPVAIHIRRVLEGLRGGTDVREQDSRSVVWF